MTRPRSEDARAYERKKADAGRRSAQASRAGRDIGSIPAVVDPARRRKADASLILFCETYFPAKFALAWSDDHRRIIAQMQTAIETGGWFALAMPRGSGKTTLCLVATIWALLTGRHAFVMVICSGEDHATALVTNMKVELQTNDLLLEDYPEVIYPIRCLEGEARRASGQLHHGKRTLIGWKADEIILPAVPGSPASGAVVRVAGITGHIRGANHARPDGVTIRPTLAIVDDPQTDESAKSPTQTANRLATIRGAIAGLAGPDKRITILIPCTVIQEDDLADQLLDRRRNPEWHGERTQMVYKFPTSERLWVQYAELREESMRNGGDGEEATEFYRKHRKAMDEGAEVAWPARFRPPSEISGLQCAMNLKLADERTFFAEYQNQPMPEVDADDLAIMTAAEIAAKTNSHKRGLIPIGCSHLTAMIDVQKRVLYYAVVAWSDDFTGAIIDYGSWPDQKLRHFSLRTVKRTLARARPGAGLEAQIYHGLEQLTAEIVPKAWKTDDGAELRIARCLIDANWGDSTDVVYQFCRQSEHAAIVMPSHGQGITASSKSMVDRKRQRGDRMGLHWLIPANTNRRGVRHVLYDTNFWKSLLHKRLAVPMGDPGCLSLYGKRASEHRMIAEHLTAEYRVRTEGRGRQVDEWKLRPGLDNHLLDCVTGTAVAASMLGAKVAGLGDGATGTRKRRRIKLSERRARHGNSAA
jgi:hypothetical protein